MPQYLYWRGTVSTDIGDPLNFTLTDGVDDPPLTIDADAEVVGDSDLGNDVIREPTSGTFNGGGWYSTSEREYGPATWNLTGFFGVTLGSIYGSTVNALEIAITGGAPYGVEFNADFIDYIDGVYHQMESGETITALSFDLQSGSILFANSGGAVETESMELQDGCSMYGPIHVIGTAAPAGALSMFGTASLGELSTTDPYCPILDIPVYMVDISTLINEGTFNYQVEVHGTVVSGDFSSLIVYGFEGALKGFRNIRDHLVYAENPTLILYSPSSPSVAPASAVLAGNSNLGTSGTLPLARVMQSSGGNLLPSDVRDDTATGDAAGGTLELPKISIGPYGVIKL